MKELIEKIDRMIEERRPLLTSDIIELVNIKSVKENALPGAPFGEGPRRLLDRVLDMGERDGFHTVDYGVGVVSLALYEGEADVGIWAHGDVVPEGDGWSYAPYDAVEYKGHVIGRGAADNKGQLCAVYNLLKIFKELGIELGYNPALYVGSNEETGMQDIIGVEGNPDARGFLNVAAPPKLSLVPDGGFPLGYGGKGGLSFILKSRSPLEKIKLTAGLAESPGTALAILDGIEPFAEGERCTVKRDGERTLVSSYSEPRHGAHPDPDGNMITYICSALLDSCELSEQNRKILGFLKLVSLDTAGKNLGIYTKSEDMGELTVFSSRVTDDEGCPRLSVNVRYPIGITADEILERVALTADGWGFDVIDVTRGVSAYTVPYDTKVARVLIDSANEVNGTDAKPYTSGGGTYAHRLPNAYVYGCSSNRAPADFPKGRGSVHGKDESVSLERLETAMKIYARALLGITRDMLG